MPRFCFWLLLFVTLLVPGIARSTPQTLPDGQSAIFPVAPHNDVTIEWWYLNANVHTNSGRHLAIIGSFFRFGNASGVVAEDSRLKVQQSHYLIYAITDIDQKKHYTYSFGDQHTLDLLQQAATLELMRDPNGPEAARITAFLNADKFPPPTRTIAAPCHVTVSPFYANYGPGNCVKSVSGAENKFLLNLSAGPSSGTVALTFTGSKRPMYVNGDGNTGLRVRTDMKYVSLTRCKVTGQIDTGTGPATVTGQGWFDHQWGDSWTTQSAGWDWWGAQLDNGTDILFFRQLNLTTGAAFFPCATFEDASGKQVTTHNIQFTYVPHSIWKSPLTGVSYPLNWTVIFPDQKVTLTISPDMEDEEMPVLANGGAIWEGSCHVSAKVGTELVSGVAYMELVGYNSPSVKAAITAAGSDGQ